MRRASAIPNRGQINSGPLRKYARRGGPRRGYARQGLLRRTKPIRGRRCRSADSRRLAQAVLRAMAFNSRSIRSCTRRIARSSIFVSVLGLVADPELPLPYARDRCLCNRELHAPVIHGHLHDSLSMTANMLAVTIFRRHVKFAVKSRIVHRNPESARGSKQAKSDSERRTPSQRVEPLGQELCSWPENHGSSNTR